MSLEVHKSEVNNLIDQSLYECKDIRDNETPIGYVYCIENTQNGKRYIGSTSRSLEERASEYVRASQRNPEDLTRPIDKILAKEGLWKFKMYRVQACYSQEELRSFERLHIIHWNTLAPNGYNNTLMTSNHTTGMKNPNYPKGILPNAQNRRKRSTAVVAVNPDKKIAYISDSINLLATEIWKKDRGILSHAASRCQKTEGFYVIYLDDVTTTNIIKKKLAKYQANEGKHKGVPNGRLEEYSMIANSLIADGPTYLICENYTIYLIYYTDTDKRWELQEYYNPNNVSEDDSNYPAQ